MQKIILLLGVIAVLGGGLFGGAYFRHQKAEKVKKEEAVDYKEKEFTYAKLERPLIIPIFKEDRTSAILIAEVWLEMDKSFTEGIFSKEPRIRDEFLQIFYRYASEGKFNQKILTPKIQARLRRDLTLGARKYLGESVRAVLLNDLQRQEM